MRLLTASEYREILGMEFPTENARKQYLKKHPKADPKRHTVKKPSGKDSPKSDSSDEESRKTWTHVRDNFAKELDLDADDAKDVLSKAEAKMKKEGPSDSTAMQTALMSTLVDEGLIPPQDDDDEGEGEWDTVYDQIRDLLH